MNIMVTGAAGFLGRRLIEHLLTLESLTDSQGHQHSINKIIACDVVPLRGIANERVQVSCGDIADSSWLANVFDHQIGTVFHLAAIVSSQAEEEFELGMRINFDATRGLLERARQLGHCPKTIITSSVAVFGGELPAVVPDEQVWAPQSSYGTQKALNDLLLADYSRRGFVDGRSLRMPTIVVRPGKPNRAASSFASGIIREPLQGIAVVCPVSPQTPLWLLSPKMAINNLIHGHQLDASQLKSGRVINLPGLSVRVQQIIDTLRRIAGNEVADLIRIQKDPLIEKIVNSWPGNFDARYAKSLGFCSDRDINSIINDFILGDLPLKGLNNEL
ncbi:3-beta hydroxysteroid dehydrogenase/isomerase family protein [Yersinia rochesterensis]|uniref:3-beta hydroxysteroid dehydrogenase/isomerase family protein n=1 Tax=Yersinia rochesterensis TaxID=1604335 RepID=A0ABN4FK53_9GAMM|nr:D-erythronate dehydrogenase [Yersinia rochesterensis]AIN16675.1 3-beta hydroxysteroid dehydrogenase/isomerase family protein [Yersinia rochesterensis]AJI87714.1 3-beta hydroxysteroid dehydrogenase/isomerase family protein [Yersinia frederiksenii Y225]AJJ37918.1 3-beta hydroxysteroid dehydrogenase/isomerase family protein [Yersinia rochesterensis]CRY64799.1 NAD-dependent epimerase/dehydratase [Yersinia kristensenii]